MPIKPSIETNDGNALTEVALALAMAFFSIMVLAMLSMSVPSAAEAAGEQTDTVAVEQQDDAAGVPLPAEAAFFAYHEGALYSAALARVAASEVPPGSVVAVPEHISVADVLSLQAQLSGSKPVITTLNADWQARLEQNVE